MGIGGTVDTGGAKYWTSYTNGSPQCNDQGYSIVYNATGARYAFVQDTTNGAYASKSFSQSSDVFHSAEWILERPSCATGNFYFRFAADIGSVNWTGDYWYSLGSGPYYGIGSSTYLERDRIVDSHGTELAKTGPIFTNEDLPLRRTPAFMEMDLAPNS